MSTARDDRKRQSPVVPASENGNPIPAGGRPRNERRKSPTPMLSRFSLLGGQRADVPAGQKEGAYVDRYDLRLVVLILVFFTLTVFDAVATVYYIDHVKGTEANPIACWMLEQGRVFFVFAKGVPTALLLLFVMVHKNFRYGRIALIIGFAFYLALAFYHVLLQWKAFQLATSGGPLL